jgi:hypothetical protein
LVPELYAENISQRLRWRKSAWRARQRIFSTVFFLIDERNLFVILVAY